MVEELHNCDRNAGFAKYAPGFVVPKVDHANNFVAYELAILVVHYEYRLVLIDSFPPIVAGLIEHDCSPKLVNEYKPN